MLPLPPCGSLQKKWKQWGVRAVASGGLERPGWHLAARIELPAQAGRVDVDPQTADGLSDVRHGRGRGRYDRRRAGGHH